MTLTSPSRPSEESATSSERRVFLRARIKLAAVYGSIITIIVLGFSIFLYQSTLRNFSDASEEDFAANGAREHFVSVASDKLQHTLFLSDVVIIVLAAGVGYVLSKKTLRPVEESHEAQRLFSAHASHELRTPLAIMRNDIEVLLRNPRPTPVEVQRTLQSNLEEIDAMTVLARDLLLIARSEQEAGTDFSSIDLTRIVSQVTDSMRTIANKAGVIIHITPGTPVLMRGNTDSLSRAFTNIIHNSIDHSAHGDTITISVTSVNSLATLSIVDTGSGIHPKHLPRIFDRFFKANGSTGKGNGLGLSIVKEIISQHAGTINITSVVGEGTAVIITLPTA